MKKAVLSTGGTGGHIFPALAVAEELKLRYPGMHIVFMGGLKGPEGDMARKAGLEFIGLPVQGFFGRGIKALGAACDMGRAVLNARAFMKKFKPDFVLGFGGYASAAAVLGGLLAHVPTAVHEQNSVPGMANKLAGRFAHRVYLSLPDTHNAFKAEKCRLTGNPLRASIAAIYDERGAGSPGAQGALTRPPQKRLLVMGGSQGARAINKAVLGALPKLLSAGFTLRWQAGPKEFEAVRASALQLEGAEQALAAGRLEISAFIDDMAGVYRWADLALCRAGATSVVELAAAGVPALFVPFPEATHNHQLHNARAVAGQGAALVLEQKDLSAERLLADLQGLFSAPGRLEAMSAAALASAKPQAAARLADELEILARI